MYIIFVLQHIESTTNAMAVSAENSIILFSKNFLHFILMLSDDFVAFLLFVISVYYKIGIVRYK